MGNRKITKKRLSTIGRRTGQNTRAGKRIRVNRDGIERFDDYWTSSDEGSIGNIPSPLCSFPAYFNAPRMSSFIKNIDLTATKELPKKVSFAKTPTFRSHAQEKQLSGAVMKHRADRKKLFAIGSRTGIDIYAGKNIRTVNGKEIFDDYFTDSSSLTSIDSGTTSKNSTSRHMNESLDKNSNFNQESKTQESDSVSLQNGDVPFEPGSPVKSNVLVKPLSPRALASLKDISKSNRRARNQELYIESYTEDEPPIEPLSPVKSMAVSEPLSSKTSKYISRDKINITPSHRMKEVVANQHSLKRTPKKLFHNGTQLISTPESLSSDEREGTFSVKDGRRPCRDTPKKMTPVKRSYIPLPVDCAERKSKIFVADQRMTLIDNVSTQTHDDSLLRLKVAGQVMDTEIDDASLIILEKTGIEVTTQANINTLRTPSEASISTPLSPRQEEIGIECAKESLDIPLDVTCSKIKNKSCVAQSPLTSVESSQSFSKEKKTNSPFLNKTATPSHQSKSHISSKHSSSPQEKGTDSLQPLRDNLESPANEIQEDHGDGSYEIVSEHTEASEDVTVSDSPSSVSANNTKLKPKHLVKRSFAKRTSSSISHSKHDVHSPHSESFSHKKSAVKNGRNSSKKAKSMQQSFSNVLETHPNTPDSGQGDDNGRVPENMPDDTVSDYPSRENSSQLKHQGVKNKESTKRSSSRHSHSKHYGGAHDGAHSPCVKSAVERGRTSGANSSSDMSVTLSACLSTVDVSQEENDSFYETMLENSNDDATVSGCRTLSSNSGNVLKLKHRDVTQKTFSKDKSFNPLNSKCNGQGHNDISSPHAKSSSCRKSGYKSGPTSFSEGNGIHPQVSVDGSGDESNETETFDDHIDANEEDVVSGSQSLMPTENGSKLKAKDNELKTLNEKINSSPLCSKNYDKSLKDNSCPRSGSSLREKSAVKSSQDNSSRSNDYQLKILDFTETDVPDPNMNDHAELASTEATSKSKKLKKKKPPVTVSASRENVNEVESSENQPRQSRRTKFPPLESWRNQRLCINYENGDIASVEVEEGSKPDNSSLDRILKRLARSKNIKNRKMSKKEKLQNNSINFKQIKKEINKAEVLDPRTGQEKLVYLHRPHDTLLWTVPPMQDKNDASYTISKCFSGEMISFGYIEIGIGKKKNEQHSPEYNIAFNVVKGSCIKMHIHKTTFNLKDLDYVVVPAGNVYSMHNKGKSVALLSFSTFKSPMFDYQFLVERMDD